MPKRSNGLQKLILFIEQQLAPEGVKVIESALLEPIEGGEPSKVDILIQGDYGNHSITIAIECQEHTRK